MDAEILADPAAEDHAEPPAHRHRRTRFDAFLHRFRHVIAASTASVVSLSVGFPLDTLKVRLQTFHYSSLAEAVARTYGAGGIRSFYRGILPPMVTVSFVKSISFSIYSTSKAFFIARLSPRSTDLVPGNSGAVPFWTLTAVSSLSGAIAGGCVAFVSCPLELIKIQRQLEELLAAQGSKVSRGSSFSSARRIVAANGFRGLYRGLVPHSARDTIGTASYFASYEVSKHFLTMALPAPAAHFLSGGLSGVCSWLLIFPIDSVKSKLQRDAQLVRSERQYSGVVDCARKTFALGGARAFYTGFSATLLRSFPLHALNWVVIERVLQWCSMPT